VRRLFGRSRRHAKLERELRQLRPEARSDFIGMIVANLRGRSPAPLLASSRLGRAGLALAVTGLMLVAFASFGGVGYASSAASQAIKKVERIVHLKSTHATRGATSAGQAQYGPFKPPKPKPKPTPKPKPNPPPAGAFKPPTTPPSQGGLPFTGLALWIPAALGLAIFLVGLVLRRLGRRNEAV